MAKDRYAWWRRRVSHALALFDIIRIDHFRGFEAYYAIPSHEATARNGKWIKGPA
jgi:4-alpha-glucanotransferase